MDIYLSFPGCFQVGAFMNNATTKDPWTCLSLEINTLSLEYNFLKWNCLVMRNVYVHLLGTVKLFSKVLHIPIRGRSLVVPHLCWYLVSSEDVITVNTELPSGHFPSFWDLGSSNPSCFGCSLRWLHSHDFVAVILSNFYG